MQPVIALPPYQAREVVQRAYVQAVIARAGGICLDPPKPDLGADLSVAASHQINGKYCATGYQFYCQLKATNVYLIEDSYIVYDMDAADYNKLAEWQGTSPCYLILYCAPADENQDYLIHSEDHLHLRRCCYWLQIDPLPTDNSSSVRVRIPRQQMFTPGAVVDLLRQQYPSS